MAERPGRVRLSFAELLDRLSIQQIKEVRRPGSRGSSAQEMARLERAVDAEIKARRIRITGRLIRLVTALAQVNLHIWEARDAMKGKRGAFRSEMKLSHQLNAIRNQLKNALLAEAGAGRSASVRTNTDREDLRGWRLSVLDA